MASVQMLFVMVREVITITIKLHCSRRHMVSKTPWESHLMADCNGPNAGAVEPTLVARSFR